MRPCFFLAGDLQFRASTKWKWNEEKEFLPWKCRDLHLIKHIQIMIYTDVFQHLRCNIVKPIQNVGKSHQPHLRRIIRACILLSVRPADLDQTAHLSSLIIGSIILSTNGMFRCRMRTARDLTKLLGCTGWFEPSLVAHVLRRGSGRKKLYVFSVGCARIRMFWP